MGEKKQEDVLEESAHTFARRGPVMAVLSILLLVPFVRRLREQRHQKHAHRRFPLLGH